MHIAYVFAYCLPCMLLALHVVQHVLCSCVLSNCCIQNGVCVFAWLVMCVALLCVLVCVAYTAGTYLLRMANAERAEAVRMKRHGIRQEDLLVHSQ